MLLLPRMTTIEDDAFVADDTMIAGYELGGGWLRVAPSKVGKRAFLGNSGMAAGGRSVPKNGLVAVLSAAPKKSKAGTSWLGSPPVRLRRTAWTSDESRTFAPAPATQGGPRRWSSCAGSSRSSCSVAVAIGVLAGLAALVDAIGPFGAAALSGAVVAVAGLIAALLTTVAKWLVVGRIRQGEHPLWSSFVWRSEVVDTFVEMVAAPWFAGRGARLAGARRLAAQPRARRSAAGCGARATGYPRPTWCDWATG